MTFEVHGPVLTPFPDPAPARSLLAVAGCCPGVHGVNAESLSGTATGRKRPEADVQPTTFLQAEAANRKAILKRI